MCSLLIHHFFCTTLIWMCFITSPITPWVINLEFGLTSRMGFLWWELMKSYSHGMDTYMHIKVNWLPVGFTIIQKLEHTQNVMKRFHHKFSWSFSNKKPRENQGCQRYRWYSQIFMAVQVHDRKDYWSTHRAVQWYWVVG